ncbi:inter-alpha-trypsin inhibitor heavy chain H3-like [Clinocottus analis]|uniref:inter-alpha-trypsin inhibitor heavy chain H3-like n=1 Tax=Clinocottus analis TaxID=304258 RepID=UPI0035C09F5C
MERAVVQITLFGLLLALATTQPNKGNWDIYSFHINSTVTSRYATTVITSRVANRMDESKEIEFHVRIPKNAFISKFRMFIDGQVYDGAVKGKEKAQQQYTEAVSRGQSAGLVSSVGRTLEEFKTSVTVAAHKKVTFELTYEELLKRRLGKYELQIHARPMQPVKDFKVDVQIKEKAGINFLEVNGGLSTNAVASAITKTQVDKQAWVYFYPTEDQQKTCDSCGEEGMNGDLVIVYDVNRNSLLGDIKKSDGYFVHHFAPSGLVSIPKNVVFVIDQSGSMYGKKIQQTRKALFHILNDLAVDDHFGLITFDSSIVHWKRELVQANEGNLQSAKTFASNIHERGSTDINKAVLEGTRMLNAHPREGSASILILLTDGDPTSGVTNLQLIHSNVRGAIADKFPLYCLGFGFDVNFEFLETMSLQNNGVARRIYEDSDADLQLKGFYEEVATPLLTDVTMIYNGGTNLTQTSFSQYYNGSEIVVAGQITDNDIETFDPQVVAISRNRRVMFNETNATVESNGTVSDSHIQRVWAYLTVKQLLEKELVLSGSEKDKVKKQALELSLKYSFVTPLTSMVVTKPQGEDSDVLHKPKEGGAPDMSSHQDFSGRRSHSLHTPQFHMPAASYPASYGLPAEGTPGGKYFWYGDVWFCSNASCGYVRIWLSINTKIPLILCIIIVYNLCCANVFTDVVLGTHMHLSPDKPPTIVTFSARPAPLSHRFLLKTENLSLPLCFDVTGEVHLRLLHHPNRELYVSGNLDSVENGGFRRIDIQLKADLFVEVETKEITVREGQTLTRHTGHYPDVITAGSLTVIRRDKEIDIAAGDTRMVILIHEKDGEEFLWPVLRLKTLDNNVSGILALKPAAYEEVQQSPSTRLKSKDQEIDVTRASAVDYTIVSSPTHDCWLMSAESALQRPLDDFIL